MLGRKITTELVCLDINNTHSVDNRFYSRWRYIRIEWSPEWMPTIDVTIAMLTTPMAQTHGNGNTLPWFEYNVCKWFWMLAKINPYWNYERQHPPLRRLQPKTAPLQRTPDKISQHASFLCTLYLINTLNFWATVSVSPSKPIVSTSFQLFCICVCHFFILLSP